MREDVIRRALALAIAHRPHPNPRVGAVVLGPDGSEISSGAHERAGGPHAEVIALQAAGERARGATLVVTLEPCDHQGRTPPCTEAILAAGIGHVVVGALDPDARVSGRGIARLKAAGVPVESGVLASEVESADPAYFHHRRTGRPRVTLKTALTLDGQVAATDRTSQWITSEAARLDAHLIRAEADAIIVGSGTLIADDPALTVRTPGYEGPQPQPVVVAGERALPGAARILARDPIVYVPRHQGVAGDEVVLPDRSGTRVDLVAMVDDLGRRGHLELMVEGGAGLAGALWDADLIDRGVFYLGSKLAGGVGSGVFDRLFRTLEDARPVQIVSAAPVGPDLRIEWLAIRD